jgi:ribosome biogenesis SPOUT family RNA methylase Rps3
MVKGAFIGTYFFQQRTETGCSAKFKRLASRNNLPEKEMRFTEHTAMKAAEQIAAGVDLEKIETTELDSLEAMIRSELQDRDMRNPNQIQMWDEQAFRSVF